MRSLTLLPFVAALGYALPQDSCSTVTVQLIVPTKTATYSSTAVVTEHPTTAKNLGTFTLVTSLFPTTTIVTVTSTAATCSASGTVSIPFSTVTEYTAYGQYARKRDLGLNPRNECSVTVTSTTTYGQTYTYVPAGQTSTFYDYTAFTQVTVTSTKSSGRAYAIESATAMTETPCGNVTVTPTSLTSTKTLDSRCSPSAMISAYQGYGMEYLSDTPTGGATYVTNTEDPSSCCQLCADAWKCAVSSWDIRTGQCRLEFPVDHTSGELNCGQGLLGYYNAGPAHPMSPGAGWYVAQVCGNAQFGAAEPDDGT